METGNFRFYRLFMIFFAGIGGILYGYDIGVISGALLFIQRDITLTTAQLSFIVAAVLGGGSIATLVSGALADMFGRRTMIIAAAVIFICGVLILISSHSYAGILTGRLIQGVGVGIVTIVVPLYLVEAAPSGIRGRSVTIFQLFLTAGILLAYVVNLAFVHTGNWRGMFACVLVPAALLFLGSLLLTESPRWLYFRGKLQKASQALAKSRPEAEVKRDMQAMKSLLGQDQHAKIGERSFLKQFFQRRYFYPFAIALAIACLNQLTGINSFLQFITLIIKHSGLQSNLVSMLGTVGVGLINFVVTVIVVFLIDKVGRKPLLIVGTGGVVIVLALLGIISHFMSPQPLQGYMVIVGMVLYIFFYALGPGVVVWLALSELLPMKIRSKGMAICLFVNSLTSTVLASVFLIIAKHLGYAGNFWICAGFTLFYFFIAVYILPETKGRSLEEIERYFCKASNVKATN